MQDASAARSQGCGGEKKWSWFSQAKGDVPGFTSCLYSPLSASFMVIANPSGNRSPAMRMLIQVKWQVKGGARARGTSQVCPDTYRIHPAYFEVKACSFEGFQQYFKRHLATQEGNSIQCLLGTGH